MSFHVRLRRELPTVARLVLALLIPMLHFGCGTTRRTQTEEALMRHRAEYQQTYLDETNARYTALLKRNKMQLDEYKAGTRKTPPVIDYLIVSGGGDVGAFGAGFLK